ncbi:MAG: hypothetical protein LC799_27335 [Actinobacteria bacterium]|nr:hypothetical protein [Actinomycetota bacterium]
MTWTKLGDEFGDAAADLSDAAVRLHVEALLWSNRLLLDLLVPVRDLRRFAFTDEADLAVAELLAAGWWEQRGTVWWIGCRWPEWQRDRVQVEHKRERDSAAQRRRRRHVLGDHSLCLAGHCRALSAVESAHDSAHDPGRVGSGRETPTPALEEKKTGAVVHGGSDTDNDGLVCADCGRSGSLLTGSTDGLHRCRKHHFARRAS